MTVIAIIFAIAWAFQTWRKRVWKRRYNAALVAYAKGYVEEMLSQAVRSMSGQDVLDAEILESKWDA